LNTVCRSDLLIAKSCYRIKELKIRTMIKGVRRLHLKNKQTEQEKKWLKLDMIEAKEQSKANFY